MQRGVASEASPVSQFAAAPQRGISPISASSHLQASASGQGFASFLAFDERRVASALAIIAGGSGVGSGSGRGGQLA